MFVIYIIGALVIGGISMWAQMKVKSNFEKYSRVRAGRGLTGAEAARQMLANAGINNVKIEQTQGFLSDHYDPTKKVIRLSPQVYNEASVSAVGVACHEAGHAIQDAKRYPFLAIRNAAVPVAGFGSSAGIILLLIGVVLSLTPLAILGLLLFAAVVFFQLVNLPVEFDATARAKRVMVESGMVSRGPEQDGMNKVLDAAALTYVAATIGSLWTLLYYAMIVFGNRE